MRKDLRTAAEAARAGFAAAALVVRRASHAAGAAARSNTRVLAVKLARGIRHADAVRRAVRVVVAAIGGRRARLAAEPPIVRHRAAYARAARDRGGYACAAKVCAGCGVVAAHGAIFLAAGDFAEVARDVLKLRGRPRSVALKVRPVGPAVLKRGRARDEQAVLIARGPRIEVQRRPEVAEFGGGGGRVAVGRRAGVVAPGAGQRGLASGCPFGLALADFAAHRRAGLLDFNRRHVEPRHAALL